MTIVEIVTVVGIGWLVLGAWLAYVLGQVISLRDRNGRQ